MRLISVSLCATLCVSAVSAQLRTLPTGYQGRPGEYLSGTGVLYPFSRSVDFDYQEVHRDWNGTTQPPLLSISFRRAPYRVANATALAHTLDATVVMGPGDYNTFGNTFAANYTSASTVVMAQRTINMPDWTQPLVPPEQFNVVMPLDAPYIVNTTADFVWELQLRNSTLPSVGSALYYADRTASTTGTASALVVGPGCVATGNSLAATLLATYSNNGTTMSVAFAGANYPPNAPVVIHLGLTNLNLPVPGLCANVIASPDIALGVGPTSAAGSLASTTIPLPYLRTLRNGRFFTQRWRPTPGSRVCR